MRRTLVLTALMAVLAVAALALTASAQTPPPSSGDWVITDSTTFTNQQVTFRGDNILISGNGHLSLTNVDLQFTGAGTHDIRVSTNARFTVSGGSISSTGGYWGATISGGPSSIDGTDLTQTSGLNLLTWKATVGNCTMISSTGDGVYVDPGDSYSRPVDVSDNRILNSTGYGIRIDIGDFGQGSDVKVICVGNNVSGSMRSGIYLTANTYKGRFMFQANELYKNAIDGLYMNMDINNVEFRIDDVRAHNNTDNGVWVRTYCSNMWAKYLSRVTSIGNGGQGVYISFDNQHWDHPVFREWYVWDNEGGGIQYRNFECATLEDSYCVNNRSQIDYSVTNTNLEIYSTTHRKGMASVTGGAYMITSFRTINLRATWQNGMPCRYNTVEFEDTTGNRLFVYTSDFEGNLGKHTEWDWRARETRSSLRHSITGYLVGGTQRLTGPAIDFNKDLVGDLVFHDIQTPDLVVDEPSSNHVQNVDNLTIKGTCKDAHSGARVVQISFDPNPSWKDKSWENATGTSSWQFIRDPFPDGVITIFVRAYDWANFPNGMYANVTITNVTVDTTAPNLTIIQPGNIITNQSQLTVLGTTDPDVVSLTLNGEYIDAFGGTFNKPIQLNEGINNILIIATDYAGNIANASRVVTLDSIPPILVVQFPTQDYYTNVDEVPIGGITDREGISLTVDGARVPVQSDGTWARNVTLAKGWNFILIDAVDVALNHRVITHKIFYDPDPPNINIFKPEPDDIINSSVFLLEGTTDTDVLNDQIRVNGIWIGLTNFAFSTEFTLLEEGATTLEFFARDRAGNERTVVVPIVIDTTPPAVTDLLPIDGEIVNSHVINVTGTTESDAEVYINGRFASLDGGGNFREQINLEEGDNDVNIRITDTAGNVRAIHRIVNLDTVPPDVFVDELAGSEFIKTSSNFHTVTGNTEPTATLVIEYGPQSDPDPAVTETIPVDENGEFSYPVMIGKNKTTQVVLRSTDYAGNTGIEAFLIKREVEEEPGFFETHPEALYGIIIVVIVLLVAYPLTQMSLNRTYDRRLKVMGYGTQTMPQYGQTPPPPPPGQRPPGPPPRRGPPQGRRPPPPPGAPGRRPPRPPAEEEGGEPAMPRETPRPPTEEEGGAPAAPRPPRDDE